MSFRSGQSGTVVRKAHMWHGRYYQDLPGTEQRRRSSVPIGAVDTMTKSQAKRKLRAMLEGMGLNDDTHLERTALDAKTFAVEAAWWRDNKLSLYKPSVQETMGSHLDKYLLPRFGSLPLAALDDRRVQEFIADLTRTAYTWPNGVSRTISPKSIQNVVGVLKLILGENVWREWTLSLPEIPIKEQRYFSPEEMRKSSRQLQANGRSCSQLWHARACDAAKPSDCTSKILTWYRVESSFAVVCGTVTKSRLSRNEGTEWSPSSQRWPRCWLHTWMGVLRGVCFRLAQVRHSARAMFDESSSRFSRV